MTVVKKYLYMGENGTMISTVLIPGVAAQVYATLIADEGKILTNGVSKQLTVTVPEAKMNDWMEVDNMGEEH